MVVGWVGRQGHTWCSGKVRGINERDEMNTFDVASVPSNTYFRESSSL